MKEKLKPKINVRFYLFSFLSWSEPVKVTETDNLGKIVVGLQGMIMNSVVEKLN